MAPPDRKARSLWRLALRLWGTRRAPCAGFLLRVAMVWRTTWRHCWPYARLSRQLADTVGQGGGFRRADAIARRRMSRRYLAGTPYSRRKSL